jgi:hypothetical protein
MWRALLVLSILLCAPLPVLGEGQDYPGLGHIKGYVLDDYSERGFDAATFEVAPGQKLELQGRTIFIKYRAEDQNNHASPLEIYLNYETILKSFQAEMLHKPVNPMDTNDHLLARFYRNGAPIYVNVSLLYNNSTGQYYQLRIVEQKEFQPSIETTPGH